MDNFVQAGNYICMTSKTLVYYTNIKENVLTVLYLFNSQAAKMLENIVATYNDIFTVMRKVISTCYFYNSILNPQFHVYIIAEHFRIYVCYTKPFYI